LLHPIRVRCIQIYLRTNSYQEKFEVVTEHGTNSSTPEVPEQAGKILAQFAGYVGFKTIEMGLASGLFAALNDNPGGLSAEELAAAAGTDAFYTGVWSKAAYGASLVELNNNKIYVLAPQMDKLLLNPEFPGYVGGIIDVFTEPEIFDNFNKNLPTGERTW